MSDLPVEEPKGGASAPAAPAAAAEPATAAPKPAEAEGTQTLELMDPELLLSAGDTPAAPPKPDAEEGPQVLDVDPSAPLALEDSFEVDKMLSTQASASSSPAPAPAAKAAPAGKSADDSMLTLMPDLTDRPAPAAPPPAKSAPAPSPKAASAPPQPETPAGPVLVPLAKRASLTAAAMKLAAATPGTAPARPPPAKPARTPAPAAAAKPSAVPQAVPPVVKPAATPMTPAAAPATPAAGATAPADAPSLASWANARAAAAANSKASPASGARPNAPAVKAALPASPEKTRTPTSAAPTAAAATAAAAGSSTSLPARGMDRDFIARNQVVERYLSGKLPIKAATDFERYCKDHPELLDEMGLPERVNAGLRLLEASGKPEPWQEGSRPIWQQPAVFFGVGGAAVLLAAVLALVAAGSAAKTHKILDLQRQVTERTLDAAASTRVIRLMPNRSGASNAPAITIGGGAEAMLADLRIDESRSPYREFRVTIDRIDEGRVMVIDNLSKDSNGHLRVAINSSALGPGNYLLTIEGLTMRLEPQPDSWVTIGVARR